MACILVLVRDVTLKLATCHCSCLEPLFQLVVADTSLIFSMVGDNYVYFTVQMGKLDIIVWLVIKMYVSSEDILHIFGY